MPELASTNDVAQAGERLASAEAFFALFPAAWDAVAREVLKLETRQEYREPGNASWEMLEAGDPEEASRLLPDSRAVDVPLYEALRRRGVDFVRCRPVAFPLTAYLQWELGCYEFNARHGEQILFVASDDVHELLENRGRHDFIVFDDTIAFVHDYDETGEIRGGWAIRDREGIIALRDLFHAFRDRCEDYKIFLKKNKSRVRAEWA